MPVYSRCSSTRLGYGRRMLVHRSASLRNSIVFLVLSNKNRQSSSQAGEGVTTECWTGTFWDLWSANNRKRSPHSSAFFFGLCGRVCGDLWLWMCRRWQWEKTDVKQILIRLVSVGEKKGRGSYAMPAESTSCFLLWTWEGKKIPQPVFPATQRVSLKTFICYSGAVWGHQDSLNVSIAEWNKSETPIKRSCESRNTGVGIFVPLKKRRCHWASLLHAWLQRWVLEYAYTKMMHPIKIRCVFLKRLSALAVKSI